MRRLFLLALWTCAAGAPTYAASPLYLSPDVPTTEAATLTTLLPWGVVRYDGSVPAYAPFFTTPGMPVLDAIHKLDGKSDWLFSVEAASDFGGALPTLADPRDVVLFDGASGTYAVVFCGAAVGIPAYANVDALYQNDDTGPLIVSFDVPTSIGALTFDPSDLVRFRRTGAGCGDWALTAGNPIFDASAAGAGVPTSANVIGADAFTGRFVLAFDVPVTLGPPGPTTYVPGQLVSWDGVSFALFEPLAGWPISGGVDGLSLLPNPGRVPPTMLVNKAPGGDLSLSWQGSCSEGGEDYGIYEGTIGTWYGHTWVDCSDAGGDRVETITPGVGNRYYLVVARHAYEEGSYGINSSGAERPVGVAACVAAQAISPCPP